MGKTGGGVGTNQYGIRGVGQARCQEAAVLDNLAGTGGERMDGKRKKGRGKNPAQEISIRAFAECTLVNTVSAETGVGERHDLVTIDDFRGETPCEWATDLVNRADTMECFVGPRRGSGYSVSAEAAGTDAVMIRVWRKGFDGLRSDTEIASRTTSVADLGIMLEGNGRSGSSPSTVLGRVARLASEMVSGA